MNYKELKLTQVEALEIMEHFNCQGISCWECPLFTDTHDCGSRRATKILALYEEETSK